MRTTSNTIRLSKSDNWFYARVYAVLVFMLLLVLYPLIYIVSASFSSAEAILKGRVMLWPVDFSLEGYTAVFENKDVWTGYRNTIFYTFAGTCINVALTMLAAYPLARKELPGRKPLMLVFGFTMIFSGGMIPTYLLVSDLNLINSVWALLLPSALSVYNMIIARSFIETSIPRDVIEAAEIDGCSDARMFISIVLPLSKAILAVLSLYYAVAHWNAYFDAFIYISRRSLYPLQIFLRDILIMNQIDVSLIDDPDLMQAKQGLADLLKYSLIIVSTAPILCLYPFVQKFFIRGVMIGSVKG